MKRNETKRYAIRKLSIGAVSLLLATTSYAVVENQPTVVQADSTNGIFYGNVNDSNLSDSVKKTVNAQLAKTVSRKINVIDQVSGKTIATTTQTVTFYRYAKVNADGTYSIGSSQDNLKDDNWGSVVSLQKMDAINDVMTALGVDQNQYHLVPGEVNTIPEITVVSPTQKVNDVNIYVSSQTTQADDDSSLLDASVVNSTANNPEYESTTDQNYANAQNALFNSDAYKNLVAFNQAQIRLNNAQTLATQAKNASDQASQSAQAAKKALDDENAKLLADQNKLSAIKDQSSSKAVALKDKIAKLQKSVTELAATQTKQATSAQANLDVANELLQNAQTAYNDAKSKNDATNGQLAALQNAVAEAKKNAENALNDSIDSEGQKLASTYFANVLKADTKPEVKTVVVYKKPAKTKKTIKITRAALNKLVKQFNSQKKKAAYKKATKTMKNSYAKAINNAKKLLKRKKISNASLTKAYKQITTAITKFTKRYRSLLKK